MNAVVFAPMPVVELPQPWRAKLATGSGALVRVRIKEEAQAAPAQEFTTDESPCGIWRDREDMSGVAAYVRRIGQPRCNRDGSRNEPCRRRLIPMH